MEKRKSPRLKDYDYATDNYYFVTICTAEKACIFGTPTSLNWMGKIVKQHIENLEDHYSEIQIDKYVVIWQRSFHDHIIRNEKAYQKIW